MSGRGTFYDPKRFSAFVDSETETPVIYALAALFDERGVTYASPCNESTLIQAA
jgi:hypothetical protein